MKYGREVVEDMHEIYELSFLVPENREDMGKLDGKLVRCFHDSEDSFALRTFRGNLNLGVVSNGLGGAHDLIFQQYMHLPEIDLLVPLDRIVTYSLYGEGRDYEFDSGGLLVNQIDFVAQGPWEVLPSVFQNDKRLLEDNKIWRGLSRGIVAV